VARRFSPFIAMPEYLTAWKVPLPASVQTEC
jgi:hypothetical protein